MSGIGRIKQVAALLAGLVLYAGCGSSDSVVREERIGARKASLEAVLSHCDCCVKHYLMTPPGSEIMKGLVKRRYGLGALLSFEGVELFYAKADANKDEVICLLEVKKVYEIEMNK